MTEQWKDIPGFSRYEASNQGRVRLRGALKPRSENSLCHGYPRIRLKNDAGKAVTKTIHYLVTRAFLGDACGRQVNHINFIRTDNRLENLEYVTPAENTAHSRKAGRYPCLKGQKRPNFNRGKPGRFKLTAAQAEEVRLSTERTYELCKRYGVSHVVIAKIKKGRYVGR